MNLIRHLTREGSANMFIRLECGYVFLSCVTWRFVALFLTTTSEGLFVCGLRQVEPRGYQEDLSKTHPGHSRPTCKRPTCVGSVRSRTHIVFCSFPLIYSSLFFFIYITLRILTKRIHAVFVPSLIEL